MTFFFCVPVTKVCGPIQEKKIRKEISLENPSFDLYISFYMISNEITFFFGLQKNIK